jgi:5'-deoxynucleotidase YfbR-like HD superfamily hydrolase
MGAKPTFSDIEKLFHGIIMPFYQIERDLSLPIQNHRNETDAEHSWSLALAACALTPQIDPKLDAGRTCQLAVVHDLVEVFAGDTSVWAKAKDHATKHERELKAQETIKEKFPMFPNVSALITEYEDKKSPESRFIWALDKFMALLALYEDKGYYYLRDKISKERFDKQFVEHRKKAHAHPVVGEYYEELVAAFAAHPEYFYQEKKSKGK